MQHLGSGKPRRRGSGSGWEVYATEATIHQNCQITKIINYYSTIMVIISHLARVVVQNRLNLNFLWFLHNNEMIFYFISFVRWTFTLANSDQERQVNLPFGVCIRGLPEIGFLEVCGVGSWGYWMKWMESVTASYFNFSNVSWSD